MKAAQTVAACFAHPEDELKMLDNYDNWFLDQFMRKVNSLSQHYLKHQISLLKKPI